MAVGQIGNGASIPRPAPRSAAWLWHGSRVATRRSAILALGLADQRSMLPKVPGLQVHNGAEGLVVCVTGPGTIFSPMDGSHRESIAQGSIPSNGYTTDRAGDTALHRAAPDPWSWPLRARVLPRHSRLSENYEPAYSAG